MVMGRPARHRYIRCGNTASAGQIPSCRRSASARDAGQPDHAKRAIDLPGTHARRRDAGGRLVRECQRRLCHLGLAAKADAVPASHTSARRALSRAVECVDRRTARVAGICRRQSVAGGEPRATHLDLRGRVPAAAAARPLLDVPRSRPLEGRDHGDRCPGHRAAACDLRPRARRRLGRHDRDQDHHSHQCRSRRRGGEHADR